MPIPRVSVCIDVYNYAEFLPAAIESVLRQTLTDFEVILVDDCSTDASYAIAQTYAAQDTRLRVQRNPKNLGMVRNRNVCLSLAQAEYVKFVHADDFCCSPDTLQRMVTRLDSNSAASLVACTTQFVCEKGLPTGQFRINFSDRRFLAGTTVITQCLLAQKNLIGGPSAVLFRRARAQRGFDERYFHAADLEMWFHLLEQGCFGYCCEPLVAYRWHPRQQTAKDLLTLSQANDQRALLATYLDKPYIRLRPWLKETLVHEAVRQTLRRCTKIAQPTQAREAISEYGTQRYYKNYPWCYAWKKVRNCLAFLQDFQNRELPLRACRLPESRPPQHPKGFNVAGFLKGQYGIGESSRAFCQAITTSGLPSVAINIASRDHSNQEQRSEGFSTHNPYGINLMTFSFDYSRRFFRDRGPRFFVGRHNIALWYWELATFPARWHTNFDYYEEIWAPSRFCQTAFATVSPVPVRHITYPLETGEEEAEDTTRERAHFSLPEETCVFLFSFDFFSTLARKNPLGVLDAFQQAFSATDKVALVLKSINSARDPQGRDSLQRAIEAVRQAGKKVVWIEEHLPGTAMRSLFAAADCYVSLHRSEGLGLGMAQAMALGKPVIATNYSGNLEYMTADNSLLVDYRLVELAEDYGPGSKPAIYERGHCWAEPDCWQAVVQMWWVYTHPIERACLGRQARQDIRTILNPAKTHAEILAYANEIYA